MKSTIEQLTVLCLVATLSASCAKESRTESIIPAGYEKVVFSARAELAKTALSGEGESKTVSWIEGDEITIFYEGGSTTAKAASSGTSTTFNAVLPEGLEDFYGVYPSDAATFTEGAFSVSVPSVQEGAFANGNLAVAKLYKESASSFKNVTSFIKVIVSDAEYTKVVLNAVGGESIAGTLAVTLDGNEPVIGEVSDGVSEITLNVSEAGTYYVAIVPDTQFSKGILAKYYKGDTPAGSYFLDRDLIIERSRIASVGALEERIGNYYASPEGAGAKTGKNEDNAMDAAALMALLNASDDADKLVAQAAALDGATIHLAAGTYDFGDMLSMKYGSPVKLTFEGAADIASVISGNDTHRIFEIGDGADVSFNNIEFTHGLGPESSVPSMLAEEGTNLNLTDCKVTYCRNYSGGGYHSLGGIVAKGTIIVDNCEFANNSASYGASLSVYADATVTNSNFHDNLGQKGPGNSIYVATAPASVSSHVVYVEKCNFTDNTTKGSADGGAFSSCDGTSTLKDCVFSGNVNESKGGSCTYMWNSAVVNFDGCAFTNCKGGNLDASLGGAILVNHSAHPTFTGCVFTDCEAYRGGAVYFGAAYEKNDVVIEFTECEFTGCYAEDEGGCINIRSTGDATYNITDCSFHGNTTPWGAVYCNNGEDGNRTIVNVSGGDFTGNIGKTRDDKNRNGAVLYPSTRSTFNVSGVRFEGNVADNGPAVFLAAETAICNCEDCEFIENEAKTNGGVIFANANTTKFYCNSSVFDSNKAKAGAVYYNGKDGFKAYFNACSFKENNWSDNYGGMIKIAESKSNNVLCLNNCSGNHNYSNGSGKTGQQCTWINLPTNNDVKFVIANTSFIGNLQDKNGNTSSSTSSSAPGIVRIDNKSGATKVKLYMVNNILTKIDEGLTNYGVASSIDSYASQYCNYNKGYSRWISGKNEPGGYFDTDGRLPKHFGDLAWDDSSNLWAWNGNNSGSNNLGATADINAAISSADSDFYAWLISVGAISSDGTTAVDARGTTRGSYSWPGSYDKGDKTGPNN
ncbi:MAG: hypothetical protein MJY55_01830 [Bacteroidales bacterium]|nr:hypothetical protein [Bacteroidales bacterium]